MHPITKDMAVYIQHQLIAFFLGLGYTATLADKFARAQVSRLDIYNP